MNIKLWLLAREGRARTIQRCLDLGADPDAVNEYSLCAVHYAGIRGWTPVIDTLAAAGANVSVENEGGLTALHYAAYHNHTAAAWALLRCFPPQLDPASRVQMPSCNLVNCCCVPLKIRHFAATVPT